MSGYSGKKLTSITKTTIFLSVVALLLLVLSVVTSVYSVNRTVKAIDAIGQVEYTAESKEKIDLAQSYYEALDTNIELPSQVSNAEKLTTAIREYVRLGIKRAYVADRDGEAEEIVIRYMEEARQTVDEYCSEGDCALISNYQDLLDLEEKYTKDNGTEPPETSAPPESSEDEEPPELC